MKRRPWFKFHTQDWRADPALRMCSPAARGLWADMLSLMHEAEPYGFLLIGGVAPTNKKLATLLSIDADLIGALIGDLEENGVFSRDDEGVIFSRRMVRDAVVADDAREHIAKRWGKSAKSKGVTSAPIRAPNREPIEKNGADPNTKSQSQSDVVAVARTRDFKAMIQEAQERAGAACNLTSGNVHHVADLRRLVDAGCDWDADVLPAIDRIAAGFKAKGQQFSSWALLNEAAIANRDRRVAGLPSPKPVTELTGHARRLEGAESPTAVVQRMAREGRI
jgi:hypothetical protein